MSRDPSRGSYAASLSRVRSTDHDLVGGKAAGLGALIGHGFPVPEGFVVTTAAYRDFLRAAGLSGLPPAELYARIPSTQFDERVAAQVRAAYADLGRPTVAVRSSATAEDLADASFAGQYETYLEVSGEESVIAAVRNCWASLWSPRAVAYREECDRSGDDLAIAVVVQRMVDAEWAGVMFTVDPVTGDRGHLVIEAVRGLGESLVSGTATGERRVVNKRSHRPVGRARRLPEQRTLVRLGIEVERVLGGPQDIEWAYVRGDYHLLQARPLTALPEESTQRGRSRGGPQWEMALDHMPYPPFPIDVDLIVRPTAGVILDGLRFAGLTGARVDEVIVEIDDGVVQVWPPRLRLGARALVGIPESAPSVRRALRTRPADYRDWVEMTLMPLVNGIDQEDLTELGDVDLLHRIDRLLTTTGRKLPERFGAMPRGWIAEAVARRLLRLIVGPAQATRLYDDLTAAVPGVTTESNAALTELARQVRETPGLRAVYLSNQPNEVHDRLSALPEGRDLLDRIDAYLGKYGFRELSIFSLGIAPLREQPDVLHCLIAGLAASDPRPTQDDPHARAAAARGELRRGGPCARLLHRPILRLIDSARTVIAFREDTHYQLVMVLAVARRVLLELGRRLVDRGGLDHADDAAYLMRDEVTLAPEAMKAVVERRREARRQALDGYTIIPAELLGRRGREDKVVGIPASRGVAVGVVRIIGGEADFGKLRTGEIMVCPFTNPTWTPLFSIAAAVVVDTGGMASHAAIVARERGIPAIMATGNGTIALHDGQRVVVNADDGAVTVVSESPGEPTAAVPTPTRD